MTTKTLEDVMEDMSELYEMVRGGDCDLRVAAELTNITGKFLKAAQLEFAKELWIERRQPPAGLLEG